MALFTALGKYKDFGLLVMRVGLGAMMITHGYPKLLGGPDLWEKLGGNTALVGITFLPVFWGAMAAITEAIGGLLIVLGLFFRPAALLMICVMVIAALSHFSRGDGLQGASHAIELGFAYFGLFILGPGKFSVDKS